MERRLSSGQDKYQAIDLGMRLPLAVTSRYWSIRAWSRTVRVGYNDTHWAHRCSVYFTITLASIQCCRDKYLVLQSSSIVPLSCRRKATTALQNCHWRSFNQASSDQPSIFADLRVPRPVQSSFVASQRHSASNIPASAGPFNDEGL